jgi:hypothetical protein
LAGSTTKKVLVRRFDGQELAGYASPATFLRPAGVEVLTRDGQAQLVAYKDLKAVYFVREFVPPPGAEEKKLFQSRPKLEGLWIRMRFRDGDMLEGILPNDLLQLMDKGVTITPPDPYSNNQRIFVPRLALSELAVLGVIGSPLTKPRRKAQPAGKQQIELFGE